MQHPMEKDKEKPMPMHGASHEMPKASDMDVEAMHKQMGTEHTTTPKKHPDDHKM